MCVNLLYYDLQCTYNVKIVLNFFGSMILAHLKYAIMD